MILPPLTVTWTWTGPYRVEIASPVAVPETPVSYAPSVNGNFFFYEGGYYVYARRAFGTTVGFAVGWTDLLTYGAVLGYVSIAIGEFAAVLLPALAPAVKLIAIGMLAAFAALQWAGVRLSSRFQEAATALKFLAFLALVVACFAYALSSPARAAGPGALPAGTLGGLVVALNVVNYTLLSYMPTYLHRRIGLSPDEALVVPLLGMLFMMLFLPIAGRLSDRIGRRPMWRCRYARSRARAASVSRKRRSSSPCAGARRSPRCTRPTCCASRKTFSSTACARSASAIPPSRSKR